MIQIKYLTGDPRGVVFYIADAIGHDGGVWTRDQEAAKPFANEAHAKAWLLNRRYDLPPMNVVFEQVEG
jgi:hypothetical protein